MIILNDKLYRKVCEGGVSLKISSKGTGSFILTIVLGCVAGSILGEIIGTNISSLSFMKSSYLIGTSAPLVLNLKAVTFTFGINFNINIMSIICVILAIIIYKRH